MGLAPVQTRSTEAMDEEISIMGSMAVQAAGAGNTDAEGQVHGEDGEGLVLAATGEDTAPVRDGGHVARIECRISLE